MDWSVAEEVQGGHIAMVTFGPQTYTAPELIMIEIKSSRM